MLALVGILVVFGAVFGGYLVEKGNPWVLLQPAELLIVGGAAIGIVLVSNPPVLIRKMIRGAVTAFLAPPVSRQSYLRSLRMLYEVFSFAQRAGVMALEADVEDPPKSRIFSRYPELLQDGDTLRFFCDSMRMLVIGVTSPQELDHLMDLDIEVQRRGQHEPVSALSAVADALPGLGIVAAVLGVVITMEAIGGSPETVGQKVAAALVGTFLGILLCYGVVGPIASRLESVSAVKTHRLEMLRNAIIAFARGSSPILSVEYGRRSIPVDSRPAFEAMEITIRREAKIPPVLRRPARRSMLLSPPPPPEPAPLPARRASTEKHRGGAWKVAYADFVTALMALFIVLWMMNSGTKVKQSVSGYFRDPRGYTRTLGAGSGSSGEGLAVHRNNVRNVQEQIESALRKMPEFRTIRNNVLFSVTGEGLRIDLLETEQGLFFATGNTAPTPSGEHLLEVLADELSKMPNQLVIEGHTDARPFRNSTLSSRYTNWELASDRANAARRILHTSGVRAEQVVETRGFAAQRLLDPKEPDSPRNRRISVVVKFPNSAAAPE